MVIKTVPLRYFWIILLTFLVACGKQAIALPTETPIPTTVSPTPIPASTLTPIIITPSPLPTEPIIPMITPDPVQLARWREYETALATSLFPSSFIPGEFLCEWEILGRSDQEVYVWAVCMSIFSVEGVGVPYGGSIPAVIHIGTDGAVQSVERPGGGTDYASDIRKMFPLDAQEKIFGHLINFQGLTDHLNWRRQHREEPPLIVLLVMPTVIPPTETSIPTVVSLPTSTLIPVTITPSPLPTQPTIPIITPDPIQVERWKEYEDALAIALFPPKYIPQSPSEFLCEWEILGRSDQEVYVWAVCMSIFSAGVNSGLPYHAEIPAVIHIGADGVVQNVEIPGGGSSYASDIRRMFPPEAQEKYFEGLIHFQELRDHLRWRREHPEEPPLIVLSATPT